MESEARRAIKTNNDDMFSREAYHPIILGGTIMRYMNLTMAAVALGAALVSAQASATSPQPLRPPQSWVNRDKLTPILGSTAPVNVEAALSVTPMGRVSSCAIMASTGNMEADKEVCKQLTIYAKFRPATDAQQQAVDGTYIFKMTI